jgi:importin subunit alpha-6/7
MDLQPSPAACEGMEERSSVLSLTPIYPANTRFSPFFQLIFSNISHQELEGLRKICSLVSNENDPFLLELVQTNILPKLIEMSNFRSDEFILEVCWILCSIGAGCSNCIQYILDIKALDFLSNAFVIDGNLSDLQDAIIWTLGNIAGESSAWRDNIIESSIFATVLQYVSRFPLGDDRKSKNLVWTMRNLCMGTPPPPKQMVTVLDRHFVDFILTSQNARVLHYSCWGLFDSSTSMKFTSHYPTDLLRKLIQLAHSDSPRVSDPAIKAIVNMIRHTDSAWPRMKELNVIANLISLIDHNKTEVKEAAIWALPQICYTCEEVIDELKDADVFTILLRKIDTEVKEVTYHITYMISDCAKIGSEKFRKYLFELKWHIKLIQHLYTIDIDLFQIGIIKGVMRICKSNIDCLDNDDKDRIKELMFYESTNFYLLRLIMNLAVLFMEYEDFV